MYGTWCAVHSIWQLGWNARGFWDFLGIERVGVGRGVVSGGLRFEANGWVDWGAGEKTNPVRGAALGNEKTNPGVGE